MANDLERCRVPLGVAAVLATVVTLAPPADRSVRAAARDAIVPDAALASVGVYYYPEAWPEPQWDRDLARIASLGFEYVHVGEFAWALLEPEDGRFDFTWLERVLALAQKHGLKVILCTPSAAPPVWLTSDHQEVRMVTASGVRVEHGARAHACWNVAAYRRYVGRIVQQLAERFGRHPAVWGWQIDNEVSHYGERCFCDACRTAFQAWLQQRYGTVDELNRAWGATFWSQRYQTFDQVPLPRAETLVQAIDPHARLDMQRWSADALAQYVAWQAGLLRDASPGRWITTNFMKLYDMADPLRSSGDLDVLTYTAYPVDGRLGNGPLGFRVGDGDELTFMNDLLRPVSPTFGIMELQPGQVNWAPVNPKPLPGAIHTWILHTIGSGARLVCTYRYRQPLSGAEMYHAGIVGTDGTTLSPGGREYAEAIADLRAMRSAARPGSTMSPEMAARRAALVYDLDSRWDLDIHPQSTRWNTMGHVMRYASALARLGAPVDVVSPAADLSGYRIVIVPAVQLVSPSFVARWRAAANAGAQVVVTTRTAQKDLLAHLWEGPWAAPLLDLIGADIEGYDVLPGELHAAVDLNGRTHRWGSWAETLHARPGTEVLGRHVDGLFAGSPAVVRRPLGRGSVTYVGVDSLDGELEADVVRGAAERASIVVERLPARVFLRWRDGLYFLTNFSSDTVAAPAPAAAQFVVGQREVPPGGAAVWRDSR